MTRARILIAVWIAALLIAACTPAPTPPAVLPTVTLIPTDTPVPRPTATAPAVPETRRDPEEQGQIRIVQAAPESGVVDAYLDLGLVASRLGLGAYTNPIEVAAGIYALQIVPTGAAAGSQILAEATVPVVAEQSYILVITGTADALTVAVYQEDLSPIAEGQTRLALIHAVPRGPASRLEVDGVPLGDPVDFGLVGTAYTVEAGAHHLTFASSETQLAELDAALAPQQAYTAILTGAVGGGSYRPLLIGTPIQTPAQVRFINAWPEAEAVDVYLGETSLALGVAYHTASDWLSRTARTYNIRVTMPAAPADARPVAETRFNLSPGQASVILLMQDRGLPALRVFATSLRPTEPLTTRLVAVNAAPDTPVAYAMVGDSPLDEIAALAYGTASRIVEMPAGLMNLFWMSGQGANARAVEPAGEISFTEGHAYIYIVTGAEYDPFLLDDEVGVNTPAGPSLLGVEGDKVAGLRVINALADGLAIRVRLDDEVLIDSLSAQAANPYLNVRQAQYTLRIGPGGGSPNAPDYAIEDLNLLDRDRISVLVYGQSEDMRTAVFADRSELVQAGTAILRIIHAAPAQGRIFARIDLPLPGEGTPQPTGTPQFSFTPSPENQGTYETRAIAPGEAGDYLGLPSNTYDIRIYRLEDSQVIAIIPRLALSGGSIYELLVLPAAGENEIRIELLADEDAWRE